MSSAVGEKSSAPRKKRKASPLQKARKKAWAAFSLYIRTRDAILTTGGIDQCVCVTCPAVKQRRAVGGAGIQAGHWPQVSGRSNAVLFLEQGVHGQCWQCNEYKHGNREPYDQFMLDTYGQEIMDELRLKKNQTVSYTVEEYDVFTTTYSEKTKQLIEKPGLAKLRRPVKIDGELPF